MVTGRMTGRQLPGQRRDAVERDEFTAFYAAGYQRHHPRQRIILTAR
jgi:hypothetical protein